MKRILLCLVIISGVYDCFAQNTTPHKFYSKEKVGAIAFDKKQDDDQFLICDEYNIMEYYQVNPKYGEGVKSIRLYFDSHLERIHNLIHFKNGIVTIRFIINCKGKTDRFRVVAVNGEYKPLDVSEVLKLKLKQIVKQMGDWQPGYYSGEYFDAYYTLSLKVKNGQVVNILP